MIDASSISPFSERTWVHDSIKIVWLLHAEHFSRVFQEAWSLTDYNIYLIGQISWLCLMTADGIKLIAFLSFVKSFIYCFVLKSWWPIPLLLADGNYLNWIVINIYHLQERGTTKINGIDHFPMGKWHLVV